MYLDFVTHSLVVKYDIKCITQMLRKMHLKFILLVEKEIEKYLKSRFIR